MSYYPFGSLKPGRYLSDTSANCVTINQSVFVEKERDSLVWQPGSPSIFMPKVLNPSLYVGQKVAATLTSDGYKLEIADTSTGGSAVALTSTIAVTPQVPQEISFGLSIQTGTFVLQAVEVINGTEYLLGSVTQSAGSVSADGGTEQIQELVLNILPSSSSVQLQLWSPLIGTVGGVGGPVVVTPGAGGTIAILGPSTGNVGICCITLGYGKWIRVKKKYLEQQNITVTLCDSIEDRYRFGFNGQEKVNEISGIGNHNTAEFWEYDARVARRWNVDPVKKAWEAGYTVFSRNPIWKIDPKGNADYYNQAGKKLGVDGNKGDGRIIIVTDKNIKEGAISNGHVTIALLNPDKQFELPPYEHRQKIKGIVSKRITDAPEKSLEVGGNGLKNANRYEMIRAMDGLEPAGNESASIELRNKDNRVSERLVHKDDIQLFKKEFGNGEYTIEYAWHLHYMGSNRNRVYSEEASQKDIENSNIESEFIIAPRKNGKGKVYFYNKNTPIREVVSPGDFGADRAINGGSSGSLKLEKFYDLQENGEPPK